MAAFEIGDAPGTASDLAIVLSGKERRVAEHLSGSVVERRSDPHAGESIFADRDGRQPRRQAAVELTPERVLDLDVTYRR